MAWPAVAEAQAHGAPGGAFAERRTRRADRLRAMAEAYRAAGDVVNATAWYDDAVAEDPTDAASWRGLAGTWADRRDLRKAIDTLRRALRVLPDDLAIWLDLVALLDRAEDAEGALRALRTLTERRPRDPAAHAALARHARARGAWTDALAAYRTIDEIARAGVGVPPELLGEATDAIPALVLILGGLDPSAGETGCEPAVEARRAPARCGS